ncbi:MAG: 5-methylthioadenosine/S-adenosylhomocysteine deaminase [Halioglobus sp.]|jgi:5-methylthioadenosine/S-adenosylhomocysteine deaminase
MQGKITSADTVIHPGWVIPMTGDSAPISEHSVAISGSQIGAILPRAEAEKISANNVLHLPGHAVMPGLINCHGHAAMSLLRGYSDDQPLMRWLEEHIWPAEAEHVSEEFVADGVELAIAEMIRSGTTSFSDMYFFPDVTAAIAQTLGMRCQISFPIFDFPTVWANDADEYISKGIKLLRQFRHSDLVSIVFGPHAPYTVSEPTLAKIATLANELDLAVHIHLHETSGEVLQAFEEHGERPLDTLNRLGLLGPKTQCVHMTDLGEQDIDLLAETGSHVIHCPRSNMKLASGACPVNKLLERGVNVALGTDGAASNNSLNMFTEMHNAALLAKLHSADATALPALEALKMATIRGARALGIEDKVGSIEVGKAADLIAVDLSGPETQPLHNPLSQLVYACNGSQVTHSWIDGQMVMEDRSLTQIDIESLAKRVSNWQQRLQSNTTK